MSYFQLIPAPSSPTLMPLVIYRVPKNQIRAIKPRHDAQRVVISNDQNCPQKRLDGQEQGRGKQLDSDVHDGKHRE